MIKKYSKYTIIVFTLLIIAYLFAWIQLDISSGKYYNQAMINFNKGNYVIALKGEKVLSADGSKYEFIGGFETASDQWSSSYAFPKPGIYSKANVMIDKIINEKVDIKLGEGMFQKYFQLDDEYLGRILLKVGNLYSKSGDSVNAQKAYQTVIDAYPFDRILVKQANEKLKLYNKNK